MRTRDGLNSHMVEMRFASTGRQFRGAKTWPVGGQIRVIEIDVPAGTIQAVDAGFDYRDRWIWLGGQILSSDLYDGLGHGLSSLPGEDSDVQHRPDAKSGITNHGTAEVTGVFYSSLGWDGSSAHTTVANQNFVQFRDNMTGAFMDLNLYCDPFTGGLTFKNGMADDYQGSVFMIVGEQLGTRIAVP